MNSLNSSARKVERGSRQHESVDHQKQTVKGQTSNPSKRKDSERFAVTIAGNLQTTWQRIALKDHSQNDVITVRMKIIS